MHVIAAKAVAFGEALTQEFRDYAHQVVANARALADALTSRQYDIVTGGTDTHLILVDLRSRHLTGRAAEQSLERAGLTCNKNGIPFDPLPPAQTSGIRLGTPAGTTRGFKEAEFEMIGHLIADVLDALGGARSAEAEARAGRGVAELIGRFPIYGASRSHPVSIPE